MPLATSARAAAACSLAGLATETEGANVLEGASAVERTKKKKGHGTKLKDIWRNTQMTSSYSQRWYMAAEMPRH